MFFILLIKGFIIGIAFIIPGVSGGTLAIYLGVYDKMLHAITHVFKEFKKSFTYLLPILIGLAASIVLLAKLLGWLIDLNSYVTLLFFVGLLIGGTPSLYAKIKGEKITTSGFLAFAAALGVVLLILIGKLVNKTDPVGIFEFSLMTYLLIFALGFVSAATMVIPGVSGSALLITLGFYTAIVTNVVGNILDFSRLAYHMQVIIPFGMGALCGIFLISKAIEISLKKYPVQTYMGIIGFIVGSVIAILFEIKDPASAPLFSDQSPIYLDLWNFLSNNVFSMILGLVSLITGIFLATKLVQIDQLFNHGKDQTHRS